MFCDTRNTLCPWRRPGTIDRRKVNSQVRLWSTRFLCGTTPQKSNSSSRCRILVSLKSEKKTKIKYLSIFFGKGEKIMRQHKERRHINYEEFSTFKRRKKAQSWGRKELFELLEDRSRSFFKTMLADSLLAWEDRVKL